MLISEVDEALKNYYRAYKETNGGHKTAKKGKYGYKTLRFKLQDADGTIYGPFFGRNSAFKAYKNEIRLKGKPVVGIKFLVEDVFKSRDKKKETKIDKVTVFEVTGVGRGRERQAQSGESAVVALSA